MDMSDALGACEVECWVNLIRLCVSTAPTLTQKWGSE